MSVNGTPGYGYTAFALSYGKRGELSYGCRLAHNAAPQPAEKYYGVVYNLEETEVYNLYWKTLKDYIWQARAEFVTGVKDPNNDADWDAYLDEMEANGLSELMEVCQEAYTRTIGSALYG